MSDETTNPVYVVWFGGSNYVTIDISSHLEKFASIEDASIALSERYRSNGQRHVQFNYVNREPSNVYCPLVDSDSSMWGWFEASYDEDTGYSVPDYPDFVIELNEQSYVSVIKGLIPYSI